MNTLDKVHIFFIIICLFLAYQTGYKAFYTIPMGLCIGKGVNKLMNLP